MTKKSGEPKKQVIMLGAWFSKDGIGYFIEKNGVCTAIKDHETWKKLFVQHIPRKG